MNGTNHHLEWQQSGIHPSLISLNLETLEESVNKVWQKLEEMGYLAKPVAV